MRETPRARLVAYGVAVLATGLSVLLRLPLVPVTESSRAKIQKVLSELGMLETNHAAATR